MEVMFFREEDESKKIKVYLENLEGFYSVSLKLVLALPSSHINRISFNSILRINGLLSMI